MTAKPSPGVESLRPIIDRIRSQMPTHGVMPTEKKGRSWDGGD